MHCELVSSEAPALTTKNGVFFSSATLAMASAAAELAPAISMFTPFWSSHSRALDEAIDVYKRQVQDFASIFRGMAYWANAAVFASADMPGDPVYTFSSANVVDGRFNYVGSALTTRYTCLLYTSRCV